MFIACCAVCRAKKPRKRRQSEMKPIIKERLLGHIQVGLHCRFACLKYWVLQMDLISFATLSCPGPVKVGGAFLRFTHVLVAKVALSVLVNCDAWWQELFSKYVVLTPLYSKKMREVTAAARQTLAFFGPGAIVQCDNGSEFQSKVSKRVSSCFSDWCCIAV